MAPHSSTLAWKIHGRRSLVGYSPWGRWKSETTERLHFHFSLSCIGEGNGNPLQCSCLENPRNGGAWWAAVYGVTQSRTRQKRLSSSSSSSKMRESVKMFKKLTIFIPKTVLTGLKNIYRSSEINFELIIMENRMLLSHFSCVRLCATP